MQRQTDVPGAAGGELAAALDMPRDQVLPFIRQTWEKWPEQLPKQEQESAPAQEAAETE